MKRIKKIYSNLITSLKIKFKQILPYMGVVCLVSLIFLAFARIQNFYPFSKKTILISDLNSQYKTFFEYYIHLFSGKESILFSWNLFGGSNMIGNFAYYLGSIFNPIILLFQNNLYIGIISLLYIKLIFISLSMFYYLSKKNCEMSLRYLLVVSYTFSGFVVGFYFNILWLDGLIYLPLAIYFLSSSNKRSKLMLKVICTLILVSNFYSAYMIFLFLVLFLVSYLDKGSKIFYEKAKKLVVSLIFSVLLSAFLILPTFYSVLQTTRNLVNIPTETKWADVLASFFSNSFPKISVASNYQSPHLYVGIGVLVLVLIVFLSKEISLILKLAYGGILLVLISGLFISQVAFVLSGFAYPTGFPYRFAFLISFMLIEIASKFHMRLINNTNLFYSLLNLIIVLLIVQLFSTYTTQVGSLIIILLFCFTLWAKNNLSYNKLVFVILGIILLSISTADMVRNGNDFLAKMDKYSHYEVIDNGNPLVQKKNIVDNSTNKQLSAFDFENNQTKNDGLFYDFRSYDGFSSLMPTDIYKMFSHMGINTTRVSADVSKESMLVELLLRIHLKDSTINNTFPFAMLVNRKDITSSFDYAKVIRSLSPTPGTTIEPTRKIIYPPSYSIEYKNGFYTYSLDLPNIDTKYAYEVFSPLVEGTLIVKNSGKSEFVKTNRQIRITPANKIKLISSNMENILRTRIYQENITKLKNVVNYQKQTKIIVNGVGHSSFKLKIGNIQKKSKAVLLSLPFNKGWNFIDDKGRKIHASKVVDDLTLLDNVNSSTIITANFTPPYFRMGIVVSLLAICLLLITYNIFDRKMEI